MGWPTGEEKLRDERIDPDTVPLEVLERKMAEFVDEATTALADNATSAKAAIVLIATGDGGALVHMAGQGELMMQLVKAATLTMLHADGGGPR